MTDTTLAEDLQALAKISEMYEDAQRERDELKASKDNLEADVIARMQEEGVDSLKSQGTNFVVSQTPYGSVNDRAAFIQWAEDTGNTELLEVKERKKLINQIAREHLDDGRPLPDGMSFYVKEYISKRAA